MQILERILQPAQKHYLPQRSMSPHLYPISNNDVAPCIQRGLWKMWRLGKIHMYVFHWTGLSLSTITDKVSGRKRIQIQCNWKGKDQSTLAEHKSTSQWSYIVHWIKVDEVAGYIMMTFDKGGLLVTGLNENFILWSLPQVSNQFHHYLLIFIHHPTH
jgi:hypothetical protein